MISYGSSEFRVYAFQPVRQIVTRNIETMFTSEYGFTLASTVIKVQLVFPYVNNLPIKIACLAQLYVGLKWQSLATIAALYKSDAVWMVSVQTLCNPP